MAGTKNDVLVGKNADFTQVAAPNPQSGEAKGLILNGQLWIGSTATNVGGTHINVGTISSPNNSITIGYVSPNITLQVTGGSTVGQTITGDTGGALSPTAGNWDILGQKAGTIPVMITTGAVSTLNIEDRTWTTSLVVDPSSTVGLRGTFTTITLALAAAVSGQTIFIRPGTYTESFSLKAGVNLSAYICDGQDAQVTIIGVSTATFTGSCSISGINFQTNGASSSVVVSGSNATVVNLINCRFNTTANTSLEHTASNVAATINVISCTGDISGGAGSVLFQVTGTGKLNILSSYFTNTGGSISSNSIAGGTGLIVSTYISQEISASLLGVLTFVDSYSECSAQNDTCITINSNAGAVITCSNSYLSSGTASSVSLNGSNSTVNIANCTIKSSNTNAIVRAGSTPTLKFANLSFIGTSSLIDALLTQVPFVSSNDAVVIKSPSAYPYTTVPQDGVILVDSSSARTIIPLASPTNGQQHRIKDSIGSAAANNITITPSGKNIDGAASYIINSNYGSIDIVYNGTEWSKF